MSPAEAETGYRSRLVQALHHQVKDMEIAKAVGAVPTSMEAVLIKSAVTALAPQLPKYLHKLDENVDARRRIASVLRLLVAAADDDERREQERAAFEGIDGD